MVTTSEIILAVIIVSLSVVMPIYYYYQRKKNPKQDNKPSDNPRLNVLSTWASEEFKEMVKKSFN